MTHTGLAIVESRWWDRGNDSVRNLFETLSGIVEGNPHAVRYDMFVEKTSLSAVIDALAKEAIYHSVYIGAHGDEMSISGDGGDVSRTELRNILNRSNNKKRIKGLYFGSCLIGTAKNASFWLSGTPKTGLDWIGGYAKQVDWIDSSAIDMVFWSKYLHERKKNRSRKRGKKTEIHMVKDASMEMKRLMPNVFSEMGFNIYHKDSGGAVVSVW